MTITNQNKRISYSGNGSTTVFAYNFKILDDDDLLVILRNSSGVDLVRIKTTNYTVSGVGDASGGNVTMLVAPAVGEELHIILDPDITQLTDYTTGGGFPAESHENALDNLTNVAKRTRDIVERSLSLGDGDTDGSGAYEANGNRIEDLGAPTAASDATTKSYVDSEIISATLDPTSTVSPFMVTVLDDLTAGDALATLGGTLIGRGIFNAVNQSTVLSLVGQSSFVQSLRTSANAPAYRTAIGVGDDLPRRNLLVNGCFDVWQLGAPLSTPPDGNYSADQWIYLEDGSNGVDLSKETDDLPEGATSRIEIDLNTGNRKFGLWQPLESIRSTPLRSKTVTISFAAKSVAGTLLDLRFHLVSFTGTANTLGATDIVSAWNAATAVPTPIANFSLVEPTVTDAEEITLTTSWATYSASFVVPAGANNIGVAFFTNDSGYLVTSTISITNVKLEENDTATLYQGMSFLDTLRDCHRFLAKTFPVDTAPVQNVGSSTNALAAVGVTGGGGHFATYDWRFPVPMVKVPTVTTYNPNAANANWYGASGDKAVVVSTPGTEAVYISSSGTPNNFESFFIHAVSDARL